MTDSMNRLKDALADRYDVREELGAGGMATVYLAHDVKHNRQVAVKILRPELAAILGADRFLKEIEVTANLQHPHILPLFDSGEAGSFLFYVMPFVDGESLRDRLQREKQLPVEDAVRIATEVAGALHYAHQRNVIHRDIKPENILLHGGSAMVADFGIALAVQQAGGNRLTETGLSLGTPQYMSPEQATADRELDAKSDVYSLGAVLYEMLAGDPPHMGSTAQAVIASVVTKAPPPVTERRPSVPPAVAGAVHRALEKLPADRFSSAEAFARALTDPTQAVAWSSGGSTGAAAAWSWRRTAGVAAVAVIVGAGVGRWSAPAPAVAPSVRFFHAPDSSHSISTLCCGSLFVISPQGDRIAYPGIVSGARSIYIRDLNEMTARALPETAGGHSLFFSPDGEWLGFGGPGGLYKTRVAGGVPTRIIAIDRAIVGATWTADGEIIYSTWPAGGYGAGETDHGFFIVSADGGEARRLTTPDAADGVDDHRMPFAVPGSDDVLLALWPTSTKVDEVRVAILRRPEGRIVPLVRGMAPQYANGQLAYATADGTVFAEPYDLDRARSLGSPRSLLGDEARDGATRVFTTGGGWADFAVAQNGTLLFMRGYERSALDIVRRNGTPGGSPFEVEVSSHMDNPRFSPDGRRLALSVAMSTAVSQHAVYVVDLASGASQRITLEHNVELVEWTMDGDSLIYAVDDRQLYLQPADRSAPARPLMEDSVTMTAFSVGRRYVAIAAYDDPVDHDLLLMDRDADSAWAYADTDFNEAAPAIAPNDRWLAYTSSETGRPEVYVSPLPGPGARTAVSQGGGSEPAWSRDGRTLYYRARVGTLVAVSVDIDGERFVMSDREDLFVVDGEIGYDRREYDVSPSGEEFVFVRVRGAARRLGIVLNALPGGRE